VHALRQRITQHGFEQAAAVGLGAGEVGFQLVAEGHEFIDFGDDAVLFGKRRQRKREGLKRSLGHMLEADPALSLPNKHIPLTIDRQSQKFRPERVTDLDATEDVLIKGGKTAFPDKCPKGSSWSN